MSIFYTGKDNIGEVGLDHLFPKQDD